MLNHSREREIFKIANLFDTSHCRTQFFVHACSYDCIQVCEIWKNIYPDILCWDRTHSVDCNIHNIIIFNVLEEYYNVSDL